jgi:hypothetical protein
MQVSQCESSISKGRLAYEIPCPAQYHCCRTRAPRPRVHIRPADDRRSAVPADAPPALIAYLRMLGPAFLGTAELNWTARNAEPSTELQSIILGNIVWFSVGPFLDV